jgi:hypothetical protein
VSSIHHIIITWSFVRTSAAQISVDSPDMYSAAYWDTNARAPISPSALRVSTPCSFLYNGLQYKIKYNRHHKEPQVSTWTEAQFSYGTWGFRIIEDSYFDLLCCNNNFQALHNHKCHTMNKHGSHSLPLHAYYRKTKQWQWLFTFFSRCILSNTTSLILTRTHYIGDMFWLIL